MSQVSCEKEKTLALIQRFHAASFLAALSHSLAVCTEGSKQFRFVRLKSIFILEKGMKYYLEKRLTEVLQDGFSFRICGFLGLEFLK